MFAKGVLGAHWAQSRAERTAPCAFRGSRWAWPTHPGLRLPPLHACMALAICVVRQMRELGSDKRRVSQVHTTGGRAGTLMQTCPPSSCVGREGGPLGSCSKASSPLLPHRECAVFSGQGVGAKQCVSLPEPRLEGSLTPRGKGLLQLRKAWGQWPGQKGQRDGVWPHCGL